ncbi:MAG: GGDEF domain-containing protein, partial [Candidatus Izemoplasmatales bacterium]
IEEINFYNHKKEVLSITLLDLDGLKLVNDNYGHLMGDKVLSSFAECIMKSFDKNDYLARIGGDEFVIIKYVKNNINLEDSIKHLRDCVKNLGLESNLPLSFTFSCGYGIYNPDEYSSFKELLERVDKKMYEKKALKKA